MKVALIGSNGLLSNELGKKCMDRKDYLTVYGIDAPCDYMYDEFICINLMNHEIDYELLSKNDVIIYAAGAGIQSNLNENYGTIYHLNTLLPIKISKALAVQSFNGTFVTFGSYFEIGANFNNHLFSEEEVANSILHVPNDYSISKRLLTRFIRSNIYTYNYLHLILPTIYGPTEAKHRLIPYTLSMIDKGETPKFTAGTQVRQYIYINDIPEIIFEFIIKGQKGIFNIGGNQCFTVKELIQSIYTQRNTQIPEGVFGSANRSDVSMENLQLNDNKLRNILPDFNFTPILEVLPLY